MEPAVHELDAGREGLFSYSFFQNRRTEEQDSTEALLVGVLYDLPSDWAVGELHA